MDKDKIFDRILGCLLGSAIGDAMGGAFEFHPEDFARKKMNGKDWIDDLYPYIDMPAGGHGSWMDNAPAGTGTDDTRYAHIFIEAAIRYGPKLSAKDIAQDIINIYKNPSTIFHHSCGEMAKLQYSAWQPLCYGILGKPFPDFPEVPPEIYAGNSMGMDLPTLMGLLLLSPAGLMHIGNPDEAYKHAYLIDFPDIGYAKEAVALLAYMTADTSGQTPQEMIRMLTDYNPFSLINLFGANRTVSQFLSDLSYIVKDTADDKVLVNKLSRKFMEECIHPFDPREVLGIAAAGLLKSDGDPLRGIMIGVNDRNSDEEGNMINFRDNDCTGYVAGALNGAYYGASKLPQSMVKKVKEANKKVYGIDIEKNARRFMERFYA